VLIFGGKIYKSEALECLIVHYYFNPNENDFNNICNCSYWLR